MAKCKGPLTPTITKIFADIMKDASDYAVFRGTDKRNFDVHTPFKFGNFGITEWDELRDIIPKKKNKVVKDLMNSLKKGMSDIHKVDVETLLTYLVMASNISTLANQRFCETLRSLIDSHSDKEKLKSKKVKLEGVGNSLN
ncbi:hypothetical protein Tco_0454844 [Tanacetum coccineum]